MAQLMEDKKILIGLMVLACFILGLAFFWLWQDSLLQGKGCPANFFRTDQGCRELRPVSVRGSRFTLGDSPFRFIGTFTFPTLTHLAYEAWRSDWKNGIDEYLDSLKPLDINVIRFFAFGPYQIEVSGQPEPNWERMDYLLNQCENRGIYVIFVPWDYWDYSFEQEGAKEVYRFWDDERIKPAIAKMVNRYKYSNAIFAWELINEGDLETIGDYYSQLYSWTGEMAAYVKSLDKRHLVATGFSGETLRETYFELPSFYQTLRNRVIEINNLPAIDFVTFHSYGGPIDLMTDAGWYGSEWENQMKWLVEEAVGISAEVGKPLLFEEWGAQRQIGETAREEVYSFMLNLFAENKIDNLFNGWGNEREPQSMLIWTEDTREIELIGEAVSGFEKQ